MDPAIEIWDLDMVMSLDNHEVPHYKTVYIFFLVDFNISQQVDEVQPHMVLGGLSKKKKKAKGKKVRNYL